MEIITEKERTMQLNRDRQKRFYDKNSQRLKNLKQIQRDNAIVIPKQKQNVINNDDVDGNAFDEISIINKVNNIEMNPATKRKRISNIRIIFNVYPNSNLVYALNNFDKMKERLDDARQINNPDIKYSPETLKVVGQTILWLIMNLPLPVKVENYRRYESWVSLLKFRSVEYKTIQQNDTQNSVLPYDVYLEKILNHFGNQSPEFLIASLYNDINARDDFGSLEIVSSIPKAIDNAVNYLVLPKSGNGTIILNEYKTKNAYGKKVFPLSITLTDLIRNFIQKNKITTHLFPRNTKNGLTKRVSVMNDAIGLDGSINILRRMRITDFLNRENNTIEDRIQFANDSMHSLNMQPYYQYTIMD